MSKRDLSDISSCPGVSDSAPLATLKPGTPVPEPTSRFVLSSGSSPTNSGAIFLRSAELRESCMRACANRGLSGSVRPPKIESSHARVGQQTLRRFAPQGDSVGVANPGAFRHFQTFFVVLSLP